MIAMHPSLITLLVTLPILALGTWLYLRLRSLSPRTHIMLAKHLPSDNQQWVQMFALPFKAYIFGVAVIYPYWRMNYPGRRAYEDTQLNLSFGCFISGFALLVVGLIQAWTKDRRVAKWNIAFAFIALISGYLLYLGAPSVK